MKGCCSAILIRSKNSLISLFPREHLNTTRELTDAVVGISPHYKDGLNITQLFLFDYRRKARSETEQRDGHLHFSGGW